MRQRLNQRGPLLIVPAMKKALLLLGFLTLTTTAAMAQTSTSGFGFLAGGSERLNGSSRDFKLSNRVYEVFYDIQLQPDSRFRIKAGQIQSPVTLFANVAGTPGSLPTAFEGKGNIDHIDAVVDYRFSEVFGSTGIFLGPALYRQKLNGGVTTSTGLTSPSGLTETEWGVTGGINADFPMTRRYAFVVEAAYHWMNFKSKQREVTLTGGLKINF